MLIFHPKNIPYAPTDNFQKVDEKLKRFSFDVKMVDNSSWDSEYPHASQPKIKKSSQIIEIWILVQQLFSKKSKSCVT